MTHAYTLGMYEKAVPSTLSYKEKLLAAKEAGYDFVELSIDETDEKLARLYMSMEERMNLVKTMYETGVPFASICLSGHRKYPLGSNDEKTEKRSLEIMEKAIKLASDLGIRMIQLAGYDVYYEEGSEETRKRFEKNLKKSTMMAAKMGVIMGFETMETEFMNTVEKSMKYVKLVDSMYLGVYPDLGNITNAAKTYNTSVLEDIETGRGHMCAMHLKETVPGVFREVQFGTGHVDFEAGIHKAWECGIRKYVTELWYTGNPQWMDDIKDAVNRMRPLLDKEETK